MSKTHIQFLEEWCQDFCNKIDDTIKSEKQQHQKVIEELEYFSFQQTRILTDLKELNNSLKQGDTGLCRFESKTWKFEKDYK